MDGLGVIGLNRMARNALTLGMPLCFSACASSPSPSNCADGVDVYAAASLRDVLGPIAQSWTQTTGTPVRHNFASSGVLAQQILATPGADVFLSANAQWMDSVQQAERVLADSRIPLVANRLVVVARADAQLPTGPEVVFHADIHHIAMGDPGSVPAGRYAQQWLESLDHQGVDGWTALKSRATHAQDVRAALDHVRSDPGVVGIVYASDAATTREVQTLFTVPPDRISPIVYPAAQIRPGCQAATAYLEALRTPEAQQAFLSHGFAPLDSQ